MNAMQRTAKVAGILFILATAAGLAGSGVLGSALKAPDFLSQISRQGNRVLVSALLSFAAACGSAGIAIALYPVLRKFNEGLALGSVGFRLIEAVFYTVGTLCLLSIFALSQESAGVSGDAAHLHGNARPSAAHGQGPGRLRPWRDGFLHWRGLVLCGVLSNQAHPALVVGLGA